MKLYKLEDIEKLVADTGMRMCMYDGGGFDCIHVFLGDFCISVFKKIFKGVPAYELLYTYTDVIQCSDMIQCSGLLDIDTTGSVGGARFFGNLHTVYENMSKKYKELLKMTKATEIKNCGTEFEI